MSTRVVTIVVAFLVFALAISVFAIPALRMSGTTAGGRLARSCSLCGRPRRLTSCCSCRPTPTAGSADWALDPGGVAQRFGARRHGLGDVVTRVHSLASAAEPYCGTDAAVSTELRRNQRWPSASAPASASRSPTPGPGGAPTSPLSGHVIHHPRSDQLLRRPVTSVAQSSSQVYQPLRAGATGRSGPSCRRGPLDSSSRSLPARTSTTVHPFRPASTPTSRLPDACVRILRRQRGVVRIPRACRSAAPRRPSRGASRSMLLSPRRRSVR